MKLERIEIEDNKVIVLLDAQTSGLTIWPGFDNKDKKVTLKYIGDKSYGYVEKLEFTARLSEEPLNIYIQEYEWGKGGRKRLYVLNIANNSVTLQKIKDEATGWFRILR